MWQRFTERARRIVFFAQEEASKLGESYVSTEHLLLGLLREPSSTACRALISMNLNLDRIAMEVQKEVVRGSGNLLSEDMQLTPRAKRVIDLAYDEARALNHDYIGTEHLLLGLVHEGEGLAARILSKLGIDIEKTRNSVLGELGIQSGGKGRGFGLHDKDLVEIAQLTAAELETIFTLAGNLKSGAIPREKQRKILEGMTLAMIFEKPSLRTRVTFETGIFQLGGQGIYLQPSDISLGKRESIHDAAKNFERMVDIIMARVFEHNTVTELARHASIPVINGLSDLEHPCQALADFLTIREKKGHFDGLKLTFVGDGNNVAHSLMLLAAKVGTDFAIACPKGYEPDAKVTAMAEGFAKETGSKIIITDDIKEAVGGADAVYTDVWASMGQEDEAAERKKIFAPYQVNAELMKLAKPDAIFEHCLPAHRGEEVTDEVIDNPQSVVFQEAENRLHVQKAVMALLAGANKLGEITNG